MLKKKIVFVFLTKVIFVTLDSFLAAKDTQKKVFAFSLSR